MGWPPRAPRLALESKSANSFPMQPLFNPLSPEFIGDPYPFYHRLRTAAPFYRSPIGFLALTRDRDVRSILGDKRFGKDFLGRTTHGANSSYLQDPVIRCMGHWMLLQDPPDHTRLRGLVVKAFTARRVQEMRPRIQAIVDAALDRLAERVRADLIADFAAQIPATVICELLGIPGEDREAFFANARSLIRLLDPVPLSRAEIELANVQNLALSQFFNRLFDLRRRKPEDDLTSQLVLAEAQGKRLSQEELTANVILLFAAGYDTTANLIGNGLFALFRHPDQLARLRSDGSLMGNAIEEFLRYDSPVQLTARAALEDVTLGDIMVQKGGSIICVVGSANRDPDVYRQPDRLDIARENIRPLSFGGGIHHCLGAQLARLEAEIAISGLISRFPNLKLDDPERPVWRPSISLRGLASLPASL
jgi:cytochrome P450